MLGRALSFSFMSFPFPSFFHGFFPVTAWKFSICEGRKERSLPSYPTPIPSSLVCFSESSQALTIPSRCASRAMRKPPFPSRRKICKPMFLKMRFFPVALSFCSPSPLPLVSHLLNQMSPVPFRWICPFYPSRCSFCLETERTFPRRLQRKVVWAGVGFSLRLPFCVVSHNFSKKKVPNTQSLSHRDFPRGVCLGVLLWVTFSCHGPLS